MSDDKDTHPKRRALLKQTGTAVAGGVFLSGIAAANPGRGNGSDNGPNRGPPFETPDTSDVVFCGCSQVCVCSANCNTVTVLVKGGPNIVMDGTVPDCVEVDEGQIVAIQDTGLPNRIICNPNLACGSFDDGTFSIYTVEGEERVYEQDDCKYGTAPQFGARCGDAFLEACPSEES